MAVELGWRGSFGHTAGSRCHIDTLEVWARSVALKGHAGDELFPEGRVGDESILASVALDGIKDAYGRSVRGLMEFARLGWAERNERGGIEGRGEAACDGGAGSLDVVEGRGRGAASADDEDDASGAGDGGGGLGIESGSASGRDTGWRPASAAALREFGGSTWSHPPAFHLKSLHGKLSRDDFLRRFESVAQPVLIANLTNSWAGEAATNQQGARV